MHAKIYVFNCLMVIDDFKCIWNCVQSTCMYNFGCHDIWLHDIFLKHPGDMGDNRSNLLNNYDILTYIQNQYVYSRFCLHEHNAGHRIQTSGKLLDLYLTRGPVTTWKIQVLLVLQNFYWT